MVMFLIKHITDRSTSDAEQMMGHLSVCTMIIIMGFVMS